MKKTIFKICRPALIFGGIVDKLQGAFKKSSGLPPSTSLAHKQDESWIVNMTTSLQTEDVKLVELMEKILQSYENELLVFESIQEFLDDSGVLNSVLSEATSVREFVAKLQQSFLK